MGTSHVSILILTLRSSSRLLSVNSLILSYVKSYLNGQEENLLYIIVYQTRCHLSVPLLVVNPCDLVVVTSVRRFGAMLRSIDMELSIFVVV